MSRPWNDWYHITSNTKSTWLHGDARGFRTRHHREHIDGDYRNPPSDGTYNSLRKRFESLITQPPVMLDQQQRMIVCNAMAEALQFHSIAFADIAITAMHFHLLAQFPAGRTTGTGKPISDPARHFTGIAKKESARRLSAIGLRPQGHTWGKRSHIVPVESEEHFSYLRDVYIPRHEREGAVVYSIHIADQGNPR